MKRKSGMTLLELTVVILVLLSLISILFIGARAWKRGSDRAANIMILRNTQQAMRSHQNMNNLDVGEAFTVADLQPYMEMPTPPHPDIQYLPFGVVTAIGTLWANPQNGGAIGFPYGPEVGETDDW